jgi:hypothetical protein
VVCVVSDEFVVAAPLAVLPVDDVLVCVVFVVLVVPVVFVVFVDGVTAACGFTTGGSIIGFK